MAENKIRKDTYLDSYRLSESSNKLSIKTKGVVPVQERPLRETLTISISGYTITLPKERYKHHIFLLMCSF